MQAALTRGVSPNLGRCELTWQTRQEIDVALAEEQHHAYERALANLGCRVIALPPEPEMPDAMFVEDPLLVFDEVAVLTRMGCESRRGEAESLARAISPYRTLRRMTAPATLEGGDVVRVDRDLFVGLSGRTNEAGIAKLRNELAPWGYRVHAVAMRGCLHLKSACCSLGDGALLANPDWLDLAPFAALQVIPVPVTESGAANVLRIGDAVLMPSCFPDTARLLRARGLNVVAVDISELMKAEAAITCSSVIFSIGADPS